MIREKKKKNRTKEKCGFAPGLSLDFLLSYFFPTIVVIATSTETPVLLGILVIKLILKLFNQITKENEHFKFMLRPESLILQH